MLVIFNMIYKPKTHLFDKLLMSCVLCSMVVSMEM